MSTTITFIVTCPKCRNAVSLKLAELENDPVCSECGTPYGELTRDERPENWRYGK